jgi:HEAT repeat protein
LLLSDQAAMVRRAAAKSLAVRGNTDLKAVFLRVASDSNVGVRKAAARALGAIPGEDVTASLISLAHDGSSAVKRTAIYMVGNRPGEVVTGALLELSAANNSGRDRVAAIKALAGRPDNETITGLLIELCRDQDTAVRHVAIRAMASRRGDEVVHWLMRLADSSIDDPPPELTSAPDRAACYETLTEIADSAQRWPVRQRQLLLHAAERLTLALTGR